jgi:hypothetical protein
MSYDENATTALSFTRSLPVGVVVVVSVVVVVDIAP